MSDRNSRYYTKVRLQRPFSMLTYHPKHGSGTIKRNKSLIDHLKTRRPHFHIRETVDRLSDYLDEEYRRFKIAKIRHTSWELISDDDVHLPDHILEQRVGAMSVETLSLSDEGLSASIKTLSIVESDEKCNSTDATEPSISTKALSFIDDGEKDDSTEATEVTDSLLCTEASDWEDDFHTCQESIAEQDDDLEHLLPTELTVHSGDLFTPSSRNGMVGSPGASGNGMSSIEMRLRATGGVQNNVATIDITLKSGETLKWEWKPQPISKVTPAAEVSQSDIENAQRRALVEVENKIEAVAGNIPSERAVSSVEPPRLIVRRSNGEELTNPRWSTASALHQHFEKRLVSVNRGPLIKRKPLPISVVARRPVLQRSKATGYVVKRRRRETLDDWAGAELDKVVSFYARKRYSSGTMVFQN